MIATADVDTLAEMAVAKQVAEDLHSAYPGHAWAVTVRGGAIIIKDLIVSSLWGYVLKILERARLERGMRTDQAVTKVDGIANYTGLGQF